jgi:hypothetical protein
MKQDGRAEQNRPGAAGRRDSPGQGKMMRASGPQAHRTTPLGIHIYLEAVGLDVSAWLAKR